MTLNIYGKHNVLRRNNNLPLPVHSQRHASNTGADLYLDNSKSTEVRFLTFHKFISARR